MSWNGTSPSVSNDGGCTIDLASVESAARFCIETAKTYGAGTCELFDPAVFARLTTRYGSMHHLQTMGS